ncbi:MAG: hypothetical protein ACI4FO_05230 [Acutalibacteraceae bacterium]
MIKNSKQVLVLVITTLMLIFSAFPLMVYANSDMTLDVEVFDANGNKYASGKMPEIHFVIRNEEGTEVTAITTNSKGTLDNTSLELEEYLKGYESAMNS